MRHVHFAIEFHIDNAVGEDWLAVYKYVIAKLIIRVDGYFNF